MKWQKLGRFLSPTSQLFWYKSHAMLPVANHIDGDLFRVSFSGRDSENRSHIGSIVMDLKSPGKILDISDRPLLSPGDLGCFDDNGVSPSCLLDVGDEKFLYYIGWKPRCTTRMSVVAGLAKSINGGQTFSRVSKAPILRRTDLEPLNIMTAPWVVKDEEVFKMWYVSGTEWIHADLPRYNIKYAESRDGVSWVQNGIVAIDNRDPEETSLARPCVVKEHDYYRMWYSFKYKSPNYLMGYAESENGINWERLDHKIGISTSDSGWDSEMIEYGSIFIHKGVKYMLYNGNGYGVSGAGIAVLEE